MKKNILGCKNPIYKMDAKSIQNLISTYGHTKVFRQIKNEYNLFVKEKTLTARFNEHINYIIKNFDFSKIPYYVENFLTKNTFDTCKINNKRSGLHKSINKKYIINDKMVFSITYQHYDGKVYLGGKTKSIKFEIILNTDSEFIAKPIKENHKIGLSKTIYLRLNTSDKLILSHTFFLKKSLERKKWEMIAYINNNSFIKENSDKYFSIDIDNDIQNKDKLKLYRYIQNLLGEHLFLIDKNKFHYFYWNYFNILKFDLNKNIINSNEIINFLFDNEYKIEESKICIDSIENIDIINLQTDLNINKHFYDLF